MVEGSNSGGIGFTSIHPSANVMLVLGMGCGQCGETFKKSLNFISFSLQNKNNEM